jgi:hypothetical protein
MRRCACERGGGDRGVRSSVGVLMERQRRSTPRSGAHGCRSMSISMYIIVVYNSRAAA